MCIPLTCPRVIAPGLYPFLIFHRSTPTLIAGEAAMRIYVDASFTRAVSETDVKILDVALVDGRFRTQCALKLLPFLGPDSILLLHDFWVRQNAYKIVLDYYYVVGYARSVVALKKKEDVFDSEETIYEKYMKTQYLTWFDIA